MIRFHVLSRFLPVVLSLCVGASLARAELQSPSEFFGHPLGRDRELLSWDDIVAYMHHVSTSSDRARWVELGETTEGRSFGMMVLSDAEGVEHHEEYRSLVRELYRAASTDRARASEISSSGKAVLAFSLGVHSTEVGASQASPELIHRIVSDEGELGQQIRRNLLVLVFPCMNPDGLETVRTWYERTKGTEAEGSEPLELYHPYAGHDNNRDGFFNNLVETSYWSKVLYHDWLPQMIVDEHQMGSSGPRLFLPPFDDPVSSTVHPLVYSQLAAAGQQVVSDLTALGYQGIATQTMFTAEWPGSVRSTGFWHNMLGVLSEVASARLATPLYSPPGSLQARGRGLSEYERRTNFLDPWPGGWWRLRDIVDLELDLTQGFLRWASQHRSDLLLHFWQMNRDAIEKGQREGPRAFVIPRVAQHDPASARRAIEILRAGGVEVEYHSEELSFADYRVEGGAWLVPTAQPFRPFLMEMLGATDYPVVRDDLGRVIRPYDVTAWSLPLLLGAKVIPVDRSAAWSAGMESDQDDPASSRPLPARGRLRIPSRDLRSFADVNRALTAGVEVRRIVDRSSEFAGDFLVDAAALARNSVGLENEAWSPFAATADGAVLTAPRVGIYSPFGGAKDEGWTRLVLERYGFSVRRIRPGQPELARPEDGDALRRTLDVLILPSIRTSELTDGRQSAGQARMHDALWPKEFRRGLGGVEAGSALRQFVESGATLVVLDDAIGWAVENLGLPVRLGLADLDEDEFYAPGTLLRSRLDLDQPVAWGMPAEAALYFASGSTLEPLAWPQRTDVVATYARRQVRMAGFLQGEQYLQGEPALLDVPLGKGRVILFGFSPQRRAQTDGTFKLLFNALWRHSAG